MPIVRLKPRGSVKRCPLLKDRKCSVHRAKLTVCAMFPIGCCLKVEADAVGTQSVLATQTQYIFNDPGCGDGKETHTVREWFGEFGIPLEDAFFVKWHQTILTLSQIFRESEKRASTHLMELAWTAAFVGLYLNYDMEQEFMLQFEKNAQEVVAVSMGFEVFSELLLLTKAHYMAWLSVWYIRQYQQGNKT